MNRTWLIVLFGFSTLVTGCAGMKAPSEPEKAIRTVPEMRVTFEQRKGAIYVQYNRALRSNPQLQGKLVVELQIAPSGKVSDCRIVSSELHSSEFENNVLSIVRQLDFGARDVKQTTVTWPMEFLPS